MKRFIIIAAFLLCLLLVLFASPAMKAAQVALSLWWNTLLPTLFPFFVCASIMEHSGALHMLANALYPISKRLHISHYALPLLLLGGITGYPSGARLCGMLQKNGDISDDEADRLGTVCNLASPMFLIGAVAGGMFFDTRLIMPLAAGHFGGAILIAVFLCVLFPVSAKKPYAVKKAAYEPLSGLLPQTIASGMGDLLKVGGTVMFFLVLGELLLQTGIMQLLGRPIDRLIPVAGMNTPASQGLLLGLLEMTGGCHMLLQAKLPIRIAAPICAFIISFGGMSVFVQAMAFVQFKKPMRYIYIKLAHGGLAALITGLLINKSTNTLEVFAPAVTPYAVNALSSVTILFSCSLGVATAFLLALLLGKWEIKR